ncbi:STAS domain-containing protein [Zhongshania aquimaris]|uniref:STAS domain-containing protein n=1 Tax=Zhongshania aquimaris TaxID=2857107 RepID=A0ABS6VU71_9GAMM|nr:STAS domain-containing protein [Zhongshania aquimaris]MBW2941870.1 STAS domain-containing protein [Zhongshania aquimaris]
MTDSAEFVILLDEPNSEKVSPKSNEFVYLLDNEAVADDGAELEKASSHLALPTFSTVDGVVALYQDLAELAASSESSIVVDASAVTDADTAVLQLLAVFVANSERSGRSVTWYKPSSYFCELAEQLDYAKYLKLDSAVASL